MACWKSHWVTLTLTLFNFQNFLSWETPPFLGFWEKVQGATRFVWNCNGRPLERVTKEKHRPSGQKLSKNVRNCVFSPSGHFFGHFVGIPVFSAVQRFARYKSEVFFSHPPPVTTVLFSCSRGLWWLASSAPAMKSRLSCCVLFWEGRKIEIFLGWYGIQNPSSLETRKSEKKNPPLPVWPPKNMEKYRKTTKKGGKYITTIYQNGQQMTIAICFFFDIFSLFSGPNREWRILWCFCFLVPGLRVLYFVQPQGNRKGKN